MDIAPLSRIDRSIDLQATPERVWRALTDRAELAAWFQVTIEGDLAEGREVWMTSTHPDHAGMRFSVVVAEMTPPRRLVWRWHPGAVDPALDYAREPRTTVTFTLEPTPGGTRLRVAETGFDAIALARRASVYRDNTEGWATVLVWLQRHVEAAQ